MEYVSLTIGVAAFLFTLYQYIRNRMIRLPNLQVHRFGPERIHIDADFDLLYVSSDADFIVTNLSDKPNTVVGLKVLADLGLGWLEGTLHATRLDERMRSRTDRPSGGQAEHYNEVFREWVTAEVCPIMLSPQSSAIPNVGIKISVAFQNNEPIRDTTGLRLELRLEDQYGKTHSFVIATPEMAMITPGRFPKKFDNEVELGRLKDRIPADKIEAVVRVMRRHFGEGPDRSELSIRRYYPWTPGKTTPNVSYISPEGYACNNFDPKRFVRAMRDGGEPPFTLREEDGFRFEFTTREGIPETLRVVLPRSWTQEKLEISIPADFAEACRPNAR